MAGDPHFVSPGDRISATWANMVVGTLRQTNATRKVRRHYGGGTSGPCPFGELTTDDEGKPALLGGFIFVGNKNHFIEPFTIDMETVRDAFVYAKIPCKVNVDDDGQLLLPNVETDNGNPTIEENTTNVPDNENPSVPAGTGVLYVPVMKLTKVDPPEGSPEGAEPTMETEFFECGNIRAEHCAGTLSYTRNNVAPTIPP